MHDPSVLRELAVHAARETGALLRHHAERGLRGLDTKSTATDMVSDADREAEELLVRILSEARPDDAILGEEGAGRDGTSGLRWVVDPLDGTTNFLHGIPHFAISIAVMETDQQGRRSITAGSVFDPVKNEFFFAEKGKGAFLNERRLRVSGRRGMADSLFATGIPFLGRGDSDAHAAFLKELAAVMAVSR